MKHIYTHLFTLVLCLFVATTALAQDNNGGVKVNAPKGLATRNNNQLGKSSKAEAKPQDVKPAETKPATATPKPAQNNTGTSGEAAKKKTENATGTTGTKTTTPKTTTAPKATTGEAAKKPSYNLQQTVKKRSVGYRIQAYSDNNFKTAKSNAQARAKSIAMKFPQYRSYITYNAPTWRLRIGDFQNQQEAKAAIASLKRAFPSFAHEFTLVRDKINIWQ